MRYRLPLACVLLSLVAVPPAFAAPPAQPNIIFVQIDDQPWPTYGFMKTIQDSGTFPVPTQHPDLPPIDTPNLDRLAARGAVFPVAVSGASVCIQSFQVTLTGYYSIELKHANFSGGQKNIPDYLADLGYQSYGYGKIWSHGYKEVGFTEGGIVTKKEIRHTIQPLWDFIDSREPGGPPWMVWFSPRLPHSPYFDSTQYNSLFPLDIFSSHKAKFRGHYSNIMLLDQRIGEVLDGLNERGLDDKTMILGLSDNGTLLAKSKKSDGENGYRTPMFVSWPGVIPANQVMTQMIHAVDLLPTMIDYAGGPVPSNLSGISLKPVLQNSSLPGREFLINQKSGPLRIFLRTADGMRFIQTAGKGHQLFDLKVDPNETTDLINDPAYADDIPIWIAAIDDWYSHLKLP